MCPALTEVYKAAHLYDHTRTVYCTFIYLFSAIICSTLFSFQSEECTYSTCPAEDCQVSHWSSWSECQVSCLSEGIDEKKVYQTRTRSITVQPDKGEQSCC